jgi:hypothetical protein
MSSSVKTKQWWDIFKSELIHHFPYGTLSVACAFMLLSIMNIFFSGGISDCVSHAHCCTDHAHSSGMDVLFHTFHFIHIIYAASGAMLMYYKYTERQLFKAILIGIFSSIGFCTISDILLPYAAGLLLGVEMNLHICFFSELQNIIPFLVIGILNGVAIAKIYDKNKENSSLQLHFFHTFISAMASIFYAVGNGLVDFHQHLGLFFLLMLVAVVLPCTLSDVVAPLFFARVLDEKSCH